MSEKEEIDIMLTDVLACWVCFRTNYEKSALLDNEWLKKFEYCIGLEITTSSVVLCETCMHDLELFYDFKTKCIKSSEVWKSIYHSNAEDLTTGETNDVIKYEPSEEGFDSGDNCCPFTEVKSECKDNIVNNKFITNDGIIEDRVNVEQKKINSCSELNIDHPQPLCCKACGKEYKMRTIYEKHVKLCHKGKVKCVLKNNTEKVPSTKAEIKTEVADKLMIPFNYECGLCKFSSFEKNILRNHVKEHYKNEMLKCNLCEFEGIDFAHMERHRYEHKSKRKSISCHICKKFFHSGIMIEYHFRKAHLRKNGGLCIICNKSYMSYKSYKNHEETHKEKSSRYACDICGRSFYYKSSLIEHIGDHSNQRRYVCEHCGSGFKRTYGLRIHIERIHGSCKPVKCNHCNKFFKSERHLADHIKKRVNKEKPFACSVCSKLFVYDYELVNHMVWHLDEKPFACNLCGAKYKSKCHLKVHYRNHTGERPYKCSVCEETFSVRGSWVRHQYSHTGQRKYKCPYCDRSFHGKGLMTAHCSTKHQKEIDKQNNEETVTKNS